MESEVTFEKPSREFPQIGVHCLNIFIESFQVQLIGKTASPARYLIVPRILAVSPAPLYLLFLPHFCELSAAATGVGTPRDGPAYPSVLVRFGSPSGLRTLAGMLASHKNMEKVTGLGSGDVLCAEGFEAFKKNLCVPLLAGL